MRIMGLDYGSKTVGVAISDELGFTAQAVETIWRKKENNLRKTCARIETLIQEKNISFIVLGKPIHLDGGSGERVEKCELFKEMLERRTGLKVYWQDERLTTVEADEILADTGVKKEDRKQYIDQVAAMLILEEYMNNMKNNG